LTKTYAVHGIQAHQSRPVNCKQSANSGKEARHPNVDRKVQLKCAILPQFERFLCNAHSFSPLAFNSFLWNEKHVVQTIRII